MGKIGRIIEKKKMKVRRTSGELSSSRRGKGHIREDISTYYIHFSRKEEQKEDDRC